MSFSILPSLQAPEDTFPNARSGFVGEPRRAPLLRAALWRAEAQARHIT
jgi:hypothetical protein